MTYILKGIKQIFLSLLEPNCIRELSSLVVYIVPIFYFDVYDVQTFVIMFSCLFINRFVDFYRLFYMTYMLYVKHPRLRYLIFRFPFC